MAKVIIYTAELCPYCARAKSLLARKGVSFEEIDITADPVLREEMTRKSGRHTVPQIWIGTAHVGGSDDLLALEREGRLDGLLTQP